MSSRYFAHFAEPAAPGTVSADVATGTGAAHDVSTTSTGTAFQPTAFQQDAFQIEPPVQTDAELASGTGSALGASVHVQPQAELASGTGEAFDATVSTILNVSANAEAAAGTGAAGGAAAAIAPNAGLSSGAGQGFDATASIPVSVNAGLASGTGSAHNATAAIGPTRFYLNTRGWPQVRPVVNAGWETGVEWLELSHSRRMMYLWHGSSDTINATSVDNQAAVHDMLMAQYISEPLAEQTISGTIRAVIQAAESNASANMRSQMHAWVMAPDGSVRGTLTTFTTGSLASEWDVSTPESRFFPVGSSGTTVTSVDAEAGDRIVVDLGARIHDTSATVYSGFLRTGDGRFTAPGTDWDLPSSQTDATTTKNGWIEFSRGLLFLAAPVAIEDDIANAIDCMPDAEGSVTAYAADISTFTTEADDPDSMFDVNYSGDLGFTGWTKLVGPTGGARVRIDGAGGLGIEPFVYVFDDPPTSGSAYEAYKETADFSTGPILTDVPDGVTKYVAIMPGDGSFEIFDVGDTNVQLVFSRARAGEIADLIADAPDLMPATENSDTVAFSPDVDFWTTEANDPQYIIDNIADPLSFTGWFKLDVPAGPGTKVVDIDTYLPIDYAEGPADTALFVFNGVPTLSSVPIAEAYFSPDGSPPAGSIDQNWGGKAKIPDLELSPGTTYYVAVVPLDGSFWEHWEEGTNLQVTVHRQLDSADVNVFPGLAAGTGQAFDAAVPGDRAVYAGYASGSGSALSARALIKANAGAGTGTGAAQDATASDIFRTYAPAGTAIGTGSSLGPRIAIAPHPGALGGVGAAYDAEPNAYAIDDTVEGDIPTGYMPPLAAPIDDDDTTLTVTTPMGSTPDLPFVIIIDGEQILVTAISPDGLTWTIERAYDDSTAAAHSAGATARPSVVRVWTGGVNITADVDYRRSRFVTAANGQPGTAEVWVRDLDRTYSFTTGDELFVKFRGIRMWGGYISDIRRQYVFPAGTGRVGDEPRYIILDCVDYNVLFNKRIYYNKVDPTNMKVRHWANGTRDALVIRQLVDDYLDLGGLGLSFDINHVGTPALPQISCNPDAPDRFGIGSGGWTWGQVMNAIVSQTGAVYYIDPDKVFRYVDDSTKQSRFGWGGVSDTPDNVNRIGYRDVEFTQDGTRLTNDHLQWGAGQGSDEMVFSRTEDEDSIDEHGRWQTGELRFDLWCQESVDQRGETWVYGSPQNRRGGNDNRFFSRVTVREPYFRVADVIVVASNEFDFARTAPVRNSEITFPTPWDIKCILTVAHELDAPWSTFEFWIPQFDFDLPSLGIGLPDLPGLPGLPGLPDPWGTFDPCEPICDDPGAPILGCVDTFTRSSASGLGTGEIDTWSSNATFKVEGFRGVAINPGFSQSEATITDHAITAPGCFKVDTRPIQAPSSSGFGGGIIFALRQGSRVPASVLYMSYSIRLNYSGDGEMTLQYSAFGDDETAWLDRGRTATTIINNYPDDQDVTWEMHFSNEEVRVVAYPTLTPNDVLFDGTINNDPNSPSTSHWHLDFVDQIVIYNANSIQVEGGGYGGVGDDAFEFDNINICCDQGCGGYEGTPIGEGLGLPGFASSGSDSETFSRTESGSWGVSEFGPEWVHDSGVSWSVEGGSGEASYDGGSGSANISGMAGRFSIPMDILWSIEWPGGTGGFAELDLYSLAPGDGTIQIILSQGFVFEVTLVGVDNTGGLVFTSVEPDPPLDVLNNQTVWTRTIITETDIGIKIWLDGDEEPDEYTLQGSSAGMDLSEVSWDELWVFADVGPGLSFRFGEITFEQGLALDESNCGDSFDDGGLIAAWGSPAGGPGGSWQIITSGSISQPDAFSGNSITEGIYLTDVNDLYYGGVAYLSGATFDEVSEFLVTFVVSPMSPTDNESSANGFGVGFAMTPSELVSPTFWGQNIAVSWNSQIPPHDHYFVSDIGLTARTITEGVMYAIRYKVDEGAGTTAYKFWEPGVEDEPNYAAGAALTVGQVAGLKIGQSGGDVWPAGTRPEVDGVTFWVGYGPDAAVPAAPGEDGCINCGDAEPGVYADPRHDGPEVGESVAETTFETGDNGGVIFHLDHQFQLGSTEVWVDGLRIRLGSDYIEYPRQGMIEILDHIDVGTEEDPASIRANYIIWTIDDPIPE